jgi:UDP-glucose 4-epimerase
MNIVITGGAGFIGSNLIDYILENDKNCKITVIDALLFDTYKYIKDKKITFINGNVTDEVLSMKLCKNIDVVFHLAANSGVIPSVKNPRLDRKYNVDGVFNYLESSARNGVEKFIFASSGSVLGEKNELLHEEMFARPESPYSASKLAGEAYCYAYYKSFGLNTTALRFSNVYGPYSFHKKLNLIPKYMMDKLSNNQKFCVYGDGYQTRDFIYVKDLVKALYLFATRDTEKGGLFQMASGTYYEINKVISFLETSMNKYCKNKIELVYKPMRKGEVRNTRVDNTKFLNTFKDFNFTDLEKGLDETAKWFYENW